jgi:DNA mismatch endonuclease (patch repair protein)
MLWKSEEGQLDVLTHEQRRLCMSRIRGRDTKPELFLRRALWRQGFRYRLDAKLPGKPDMAFLGRKAVVFVDGCFWHGCSEHGVKPKTNASFWAKKLARNCERDREVRAMLEAQGWTVIRVWEHEVRADLDAVTERVCDILFSNSSHNPAS